MENKEINLSLKNKNMEVTVMPNPASVEKQQGLNQVVINKVQRMVEGKRQGVMETIARLLDEGKIAQDFIAPIGVNLRGKEKQPVISFRAADRVQMTMPEGNFSLHGNAIRYAVQGDVDGIRYKLVSADGLRFCPYRIN